MSHLSPSSLEPQPYQCIISTEIAPEPPFEFTSLRTLGQALQSSVCGDYLAYEGEEQDDQMVAEGVYLVGGQRWDQIDLGRSDEQELGLNRKGEWHESLVDLCCTDIEV